MTSRLGNIYNHRKDTLTGNEPKFGVQHYKTDNLPSSFDLRTATTCVPAVLDQKTVGCCCSSAISNALRFCLNTEAVKNKQPLCNYQPSRLFHYYFARLYEGLDVNSDTGLSIKGGIESLEKNGTCSENWVSYDISKFTEKPCDGAIAAALTHITKVQALSIPQDLESIKHAIYSGYPIILGIQVYSSLESDSTISSGIIPMPDTTNETYMGGHCVGIYGYDNNTQRFLLQNSWGTENVGQEGYFTIPYQYICDPNLTSDLWQIRYYK